MKKIIFFCFFISVLFSAQNQEFSYEYRFVPDSTNSSKVEIEFMNLDISKKGSKFFSSNQKVADSIISSKSRQNSGPMDISGIKFGKVQEVVEKMYPNFDIYLFQRLDTDNYKVKDERKINWTILPEKEKIGNWETQKATTEMYGRKWTAWFADAFPFQDGPYKFHGLPGLIIKISDESNTHVFELKAVKNLAANDDWESAGLKNNFTKPILLNEDKFKKVYQKYREDPVAGMRQMMSQSYTKVVMVDEHGKVMDMKKALIDSEKRMKESFKNDNNLLELDLIK